MAMSGKLPASHMLQATWLRRIVQWRMLVSLCVCLIFALAPAIAEARAGSSSGKSSSSMGTRGSRSFDQNGAAPLTRSATPAPAAPRAAAGMAGGAAAATGGSFFSRHPFLTGIAGGFLGSMLFSHLGGFGGMGGMGSVFGGILQFLIIGLLIFLVVRFFMRRRGSWGGTAAGPMAAPMPRAVGAAVSPAPRFRGVDTTVGDADLSAFQQIHGAVQEAWSRADLGALRQVMTPEMLGYFSEELTRSASQGVQNIVSDVRLLKGDISESWEEGDLQYATAFMRWSALDYVARLGAAPGTPGYVVSGDPARPTESEEAWTFVRRRGGNWLLSAVQQV
jgi:predicted lipid-binding transport protein (Tim44 family)